ncbi:MAG: hypothetical protein P1V20_31120 [Verrucomicrobiales bacterium]|nr:hypothetical protein [Verrucomicrobiales bacterium]
MSRKKRTYLKTHKWHFIILAIWIIVGLIVFVIGFLKNSGVL